MKVVYKEVLYKGRFDNLYVLGLGNAIHVPMNKGSRIINFQQNPFDGTICVWYECVPGEPMEERVFWLAFTGSSYPQNLHAIASTPYAPGGLWVHLLEERKDA